jgi:hypothetical protein
MCGETSPVKDFFKKGESPKRRKLNKGGKPETDFIKIESYEYAQPWDGKPKRYSSYA